MSFGNKLLITYFQIIIVETKYHSADASTSSSSKNSKLFNWTLTPYIQNLYHYISLFLFAESIERCLSEGIKVTIGRLRPHFMNVSYDCDWLLISYCYFIRGEAREGSKGSISTPSKYFFLKNHFFSNFIPETNLLSTYHGRKGGFKWVRTPYPHFKKFFSSEK